MTCVRVSYKKSFRSSACNFINKETLAQMLCSEFCKIIKNTFFTEQFWKTDSGAVDFNKGTQKILLVIFLTLITKTDLYFTFLINFKQSYDKVFVLEFSLSFNERAKVAFLQVGKLFFFQYLLDVKNALNYLRWKLNTSSYLSKQNNIS